MFIPKLSKKTSNPITIDTVIRDLETYMLKVIRPDSEEYAKNVDLLAKLYKMKEANASRRVSPDALLSAGVSILSVLLILNHERLGVVTSKAMSFVKIR